MSRYNLRPNLLEDILQEFELVRLQGVEWRRLKKRHRTSVHDVGQRLPVHDYNTRGDLAFRMSLLSLMTITPKPRCRGRGFVVEMGAFLQRPISMSLEGERTCLVPITMRTRTGSNAKNSAAHAQEVPASLSLGLITAASEVLRREQMFDCQEWQQYQA